MMVRTSFKHFQCTYLNSPRGDNSIWKLNAFFPFKFGTYIRTRICSFNLHRSLFRYFIRLEDEIPPHRIIHIAAR